MNGHKRSKTLPLIAAAAALLILQMPSAADPPAASPRGRPVTFDGSCSLKGTVTFTPGATLFAQELEVDFVGDGTCSGKLNESEIEDVPVKVHQFARSEGSCLEARTTSPGPGEITFPGGERLTYTIEFTYDLANQTDLTYRGTHSGTGHGSGTFRTDRTPPDTLARCATPDGAGKVPMDIEMATDSVLRSKNH